MGQIQTQQQQLRECLVIDTDREELSRSLMPGKSKLLLTSQRTPAADNPSTQASIRAEAEAIGRVNPLAIVPATTVPGIC